ncbi:MAG: hypothetical protein R3F19_19710 [Verrucomicrobiales bacterium]
MFAFIIRALLGSLALLAIAPFAGGHAMDTNLYVQIHLHEDKLVCEVDVGSFQFPPLKDVVFAHPETHPTLEEKREEIEKFFRENCPFSIDGIVVQPVLTSLKLEDFEAADHLMRQMDIVYVGLKMEYSLKREPKQIAMKWGFFAQPHEGEEFPAITDDPLAVVDDPQEVVADFIIHGDPDQYDLVYFSPREPEYIWHRPVPERSEEELVAITTVREGSAGSVSVRRYGFIGGGVGLVLLGLVVGRGQGKAKVLTGGLLAVLGVACFAGGFIQPKNDQPLADQEAIDTFKALQANIYAAFDYDTEDEIYDALGQSVDGALLDHVYNDVFESLILRSEGGVMAKVQKVEVLKAEVTAAPTATSDSFVIDCLWRVHGFVKHYSHTHRRLNEYQATFEMAPRDGKWKIIKSVETKRERLDGQLQGSSAGGVMPPEGAAAAEDFLKGTETGDSLPGEADPSSEEDLDLPGILDGNTME